MKFRYDNFGRQYLLFDEGEDISYNILARELHQVLDNGETYYLKNLRINKIKKKVYKIEYDSKWNGILAETLYGNHSLMCIFRNHVNNINDYFKSRNIINIMNDL